MSLQKFAYILCLVGIYTTWMLSFSYILHIQLPCGGSDGCTALALSPAARVAGVPIPLFGLAFYAILTVIAARTLFQARQQPLSYLLAICGAAVSTGYTIYGEFVLHAECPWCIASNLTACLLAVIYGFDRTDRPSRAREGAQVHELAAKEKVPAVGRARPFRFVAPFLNFERTGERGNPMIFLVATTLLTVVAMAVGASATYRNARRFPWNPDALSRISATELVPPDSVVLNGNERGPTLVIFLDLECPACQTAFQAVIDAARKHRLRIAIRHFPHKIHVGSYALAVLSEEAAQQGQGLNFLQQALKEGIDNRRSGAALLRALNAHESAEMRQVGRTRVKRDLALATKLGLTQTPSIFIVRPNHPPEPTSPESLPELADPR
jgi:uncharacterized membrane protein/protein-disulfide isomerase